MITPNVEFLRLVRARVEAGWCKGAYAIDEDGNSIYSRAPRACKWCLAGAILKEADGRYDSGYIQDILGRAVTNLYPERRGKNAPYGEAGFVGFNDHRDTTQEMVLAVIDEAIRLTEAA